jgi:hypothetical protein
MTQIDAFQTTGQSPGGRTLDSKRDGSTVLAHYAIRRICATDGDEQAQWIVELEAILKNAPETEAWDRVAKLAACAVAR